MPGRLQDRIAIVTGADSGIGRAIAEAFAEEGADLAITFLSDEEGASETCRRVEARGRRCLALLCDQRDPEQVEALFRRVRQDLGLPFLLVNNAGTNPPSAPVADLSLEDWDSTLRTNLYGPFYCCRAFIRLRREAGGAGRIINITSVHEEIPSAGAAAYDASKGGLRNLTRTLCLELAPLRINVNNIAPGMVLTPMNQQALDDPAARREQESHIPWKRAAKPEEVAGLAVWLASDAADYVSGQSFTIDGGLSLLLGQGA